MPSISESRSVSKGVRFETVSMQTKIPACHAYNFALIMFSAFHIGPSLNRPDFVSPNENNSKPVWDQISLEFCRPTNVACSWKCKLFIIIFSEIRDKTGGTKYVTKQTLFSYFINVKNAPLSGTVVTHDCPEWSSIIVFPILGYMLIGLANPLRSRIYASKIQFSIGLYYSGASVVTSVLPCPVILSNISQFTNPRSGQWIAYGENKRVIIVLS